MLRLVNLDMDKWTSIFKIEQIRSVEDLEAVLLEDGEDSDLAREMKSSERIKFRAIKEAGKMFTSTIIVQCPYLNTLYF